jgi:hypothetical protein
MIKRYRLIVISIFASVATCLAEPSPLFTFKITDQPQQLRFVISLRSSDKRPICIYRHMWPNAMGQLHFGSTWVRLESAQGAFAARDSNFGFCGGGPNCFLRIDPGDVLRGYIGYEQFGKPRTIARLKRRKLVFAVSPARCP